MARNLYVVVDEEKETILRHGFFGKQVFTSKKAAKAHAPGENETVYKLTKHGV